MLRISSTKQGEKRQFIGVSNVWARHWLGPGVQIGQLLLSLLNVSFARPIARTVVVNHHLWFNSLPIYYCYYSFTIDTLPNRSLLQTLASLSSSTYGLSLCSTGIQSSDEIFFGFIPATSEFPGFSPPSQSHCHEKRWPPPFQG